MYGKPIWRADPRETIAQLKIYAIMVVCVGLPVALLFGGFEALDWLGRPTQTMRIPRYTVQTVAAHTEQGVHDTFDIPTTWVLHLTLPDGRDHTITYYPRDWPQWLDDRPAIAASYTMGRISHKAWLRAIWPIAARAK